MFSRVQKIVDKHFVKDVGMTGGIVGMPFYMAGKYVGDKIMIRKESSDDVSFLGIMAGTFPALAGCIVGATVVAPIHTAYICGTRYRFHLNLIELRWLVVYGIPLLKSYPKTERQRNASFLLESAKFVYTPNRWSSSRSSAMLCQYDDPELVIRYLENFQDNNGKRLYKTLYQVLEQCHPLSILSAVYLIPDLAQIVWQYWIVFGGSPSRRSWMS
jgi:nitrate reductase NapE component